MTIKEWPLEERPREKLLLKGAQVLSDAELLAIFLRTGKKGQSAVDLARELMGHFKNLRSLFHSSLEEFQAVSGMGITRYVHLKAILEMSQRYLLEASKTGDVLSDTKTVKRYLLAKMSHQLQEIFGCVFLNTKNELIAFQELFRGTIHTTEVYPREIIRSALAHNASAILLAHNHPSGDPEPSATDVALTERLRPLLLSVDIQLLDHLIVGRSEVVSLAERGLIG